MNGRLALVSLLVLSGLAVAGVQLVDGNGIPHRWDLDTQQPNVVNGKVTFYLDPAGTTDALSGGSELTALRNAIESWNVPTTRLRTMEDASRPATGANANDRVNFVGWTRRGLGPLTFAVTIPTRSGERLLDMDILFNDRFAWETRTPGRNGFADVQALMTHEWGHAIGADHVPMRASTMYFATDEGRIDYRSLAPDDVALVGRIYPNDAFRQLTGTLAGTVTRVGAGDHRGIHVIAISLFTGDPAVSTLTAPDGSYRLEGVPAGGYRIVAAPAVPRNALNSFWSSANTSFLPSVLGASDTAPAAASAVLSSPGTVTQVPAFSVRSVSSPLEPNDGTGQATPLELGDAVCARLESSADEDWYRFDGVAGQRVTVSLVAHAIGSAADPAIELLRFVSGTLTQPGECDECEDIRDPDVFERLSDGPNRDARIVGYELPADDTYYVRVRRESAIGPDGFYALFVTAASDSPSALFTTVEADPPRIDADGAARTTIAVTPRRETGEDVGPGATLTFAQDGAGELDTVGPSEQDGVYTIGVTAPSTPGTEHFDVTIETPAGTATAQNAVTVVYLGPPDAGSSSLSVTPRRIEADGMAHATLLLRPRDARGEGLGSGRAVSFSLDPVVVAAGAVVGPVTEEEDGAYWALLTSPTAGGTSTVGATVEGVPLGTLGSLAFGFPLDEVLAQAAADVVLFLGDGTLRRRAKVPLRAAARLLARAETDRAAGRARRTVARTRAALARILRARRLSRGGLADPGTDEDLARAVRQAAREALAAAVVVTRRHQVRRDRAEFLIANGDAFLDAGARNAATRRYIAGYRKVIGLVP